MEKRITEEQLAILRRKVDEKGYVSQAEFHKFIHVLDISYPTLIREFYRNEIPFQLHNLLHLLKICKIEVVGKKVVLKSFMNLENRLKALFLQSKIRATFECQECGIKADGALGKMSTREFFKLEPICQSCIGKKVQSTPEWREKNSQAQLIAQNRPGAPERMGAIIKKRFESTGYRKKMSEASKKVWQRPGYRDKMVVMLEERMSDKEYVKNLLKKTRKGQKVGTIDGVYFQSSYELAFLLIEKEERGSLSHVKRLEEPIMYIHPCGRVKRYFPDFIKDNSILVEIKGGGPWMELDVVAAKNKAAKAWCKKNGMKFRIMFSKDLTSYWIRQARKWLTTNLHGSGETKVDKKV